MELTALICWDEHNVMLSEGRQLYIGDTSAGVKREPRNYFLLESETDLSLGCMGLYHSVFALFFQYGWHAFGNCLLCIVEIWFTIFPHGYFVPYVDKLHLVFVIELFAS